MNQSKFPEGTRVRVVNWDVADNVTGVVMGGHRNAVRFDHKVKNWGLDWAHGFRGDQLVKVEPPTPFEADLIAYIASEKRALGLL